MKYIHCDNFHDFFLINLFISVNNIYIRLSYVTLHSGKVFQYLAIYVEFITL